MSVLAGNSPRHHSSRKSSSQSESTPLSSPSSLQPPSSSNPFAVSHDSGHSDHWSGSGSSSGGQSPLLVSCGGRENGRNADEPRRHTLFSGAIEMKNTLHIETAGLPDPNHEAPSPLSPKGLQFRYRPFLPSTSLQSPIPRLANSLVSGATPSSLRPPRPLSTSLLLLHDKHLSPFNSDTLGPHSYGHPHTHPHTTTHRQVSKLRASLGVPPPSLPRLATKPETETPSKSFLNRLSVYSPLSKLSVSTSFDEHSVVVMGVREGGGRGEGVGKKRRNSEASIDHEESVMESGSSLAESCDEGIDMATKQM